MGTPAHAARPLQGLYRAARLLGQPLGFTEQVPGPDVLGIVQGDARKRGDRFGIVAGAEPGVTGYDRPFGTRQLAALLLLGVAQEPCPVPFAVEIGDVLPLGVAVSAPGERQPGKRIDRGFRLLLPRGETLTSGKPNTSREGCDERPGAEVRPCFDRRRLAA